MSTQPIDTVGKEPIFEVEDVKKGVVHHEVRHYVPITDEEKALDRKVNMKLDAVVLVILSIAFIVSLAPKS
jgi:MFS transporter, ACS family, DAL5 transporter family protein